MLQGLQQSAISNRTPVLDFNHSILFFLHSWGFFLLHSFSFHFEWQKWGTFSCEQTNSILSIVRLRGTWIVDARQCWLPLLLPFILPNQQNLRIIRLIQKRVGRWHHVIILCEILLPFMLPQEHTRNRINFTMSCLSRSSVSHTRLVAMCGIWTFISARIWIRRFCVLSAK